MDIPNLATQQPPIVNSDTNQKQPLIIVAIVFVSIIIGFWVSRFYPLTQQSKITNANTTEALNSTDNISKSSDVKTNVVYGNKDSTCKDSASGTLEKGNINGDGTHILNRPGGADQRAALTSSAVDLDLFVGKKVEITGQTNSSKKSGWLLDVCSIKIVE